jgi:hypothetical protein
MAANSSQAFTYPYTHTTNDSSTIQSIQQKNTTYHYSLQIRHISSIYKTYGPYEATHQTVHICAICSCTYTVRIRPPPASSTTVTQPAYYK